MPTLCPESDYVAGMGPDGGSAQDQFLLKWHRGGSYESNLFRISSFIPGAIVEVLLVKAQLLTAVLG